MNVKPKFVYYDIRRKQSVSLIMYTHENDVDTQVLEVSMLDNGEPIELSADYTYSAAIVNRDTKALINDNISCELNDSGNVLIPIDNFHTLGAQDLLIELTITDSAGNQVLVTPFPLWIHVNASILDDAQVTPESQGTVPELLEDAEKALEDAQQAIEDAGDYENLENKPQINGRELSGNKTGDDLGLQGKLTAGENITIDANGEISATGGTDDYEELTHKPQIQNSIASDQKETELKGILKLSSEFDIDLQNENQIYLHLNDNSIVRNRLNSNLRESLLYRASLWTPLPQNINSWGDDTRTKNVIAVIDDQSFSSPTPPAGILSSRPSTIISSLESTNSPCGFQIIIAYDSSKTKPRMVLRCRHSFFGEMFTEWREVAFKNDISTFTSATVNQNGTITFTMSDGSTVTTTGESVIGESAYQVAVDNGFIGTEQEWLASLKGEQGDAYVLTAQDKSDIAAIVLSELPTTQGVQYGNTSN